MTNLRISSRRKDEDTEILYELDSDLNAIDDKLDRPEVSTSEEEEKLRGSQFNAD